MKRGTIGHTKTLHLASLLGIEHLHAVGVLEAFWHWVAAAAPTGAMGAGAPSHLATSIGWRGESSSLVDAFHRAGFVDPHPLHTYVVHDWSEHATDQVHTTLAGAGKLFWDGAVPSTSGLKSERRAAAAELLARAAERFRAESAAGGQPPTEPPTGPRKVQGLSMDRPREPLPLPLPSNGTTTAPPSPRAVQKPLALIGEARPTKAAKKAASFEDMEALRRELELLVECGACRSFDHALELASDGSAKDGKRRCQAAVRVETMSQDHVTRSLRDARLLLERWVRRHGSVEALNDAEV